MQQLQGWVALHHHSGLCSLKWQVNINFSPWPLPRPYDWFLHWSISMKLVSQLVGWSQGFGEFSCGFFCGLAGFCFVLIVCLFVCFFLVFLLCGLVFWDGNSKKNPNICLKGFRGFLAAMGRESDRAKAERQETTLNIRQNSATGHRPVEEVILKELLKQTLGSPKTVLS